LLQRHLEAGGSKRKLGGLNDRGVPYALKRRVGRARNETAASEGRLGGRWQRCSGSPEGKLHSTEALPSNAQTLPANFLESRKRLEQAKFHGRVFAEALPWNSDDGRARQARNRLNKPNPGPRKPSIDGREVVVPTAWSRKLAGLDADRERGIVSASFRLVFWFFVGHRTAQKVQLPRVDTIESAP
jgi:hypothetical protein